MKYLDICNSSSIRKIEEAYVGIIKPKNYVKWQQTEAITLFLEGIHQFCVKSVNRTFNVVLATNERIVPTQIRDFILYAEPDYVTYYLKSSCDILSSIYIAHFEVFKKKDYEASSLCARGVLYLAKIKSAENQKYE